MARLYEYVPTSDKSGFFLLGSNSGDNTTIQVRPLGDRVFEHLDYNAGRRTTAGPRGEKLPRELVDWLWNARLLYTESGEDSTDTSLRSVLDLDDDAVEFDDSDIEQLVEFVKLYDAGEDIDLREELVDILGVDTVEHYEQTTSGATDGTDSQSLDETQTSPESDTSGSNEQLSEDERAELVGYLSTAIDESTDTVSLENHLPRANNPRDWLWSVRQFLSDSDAFVHRAAIGSDGDPVYNMQTGQIQWDLYDLRCSEADPADFLVVVNPLSGHSPKQSFRVAESGIIDWQSYEDYLGIRQVRELISIVPSVQRTLRSVPGFESTTVWTFPQPSSRAMLNAQSVVNQSLQAAGEPFDIEPANSTIWGEVVGISPKGWIEIRLQTNRAVVVTVEKFTDEPSVGDWVLLEPTDYTDWPTDFSVITTE